MTISGNFERLQYFNFELDFLENGNLLVETTKIENVSFPYKTVIWDASVKTNTMVSTKWTYCKEQSFPSNYFIFWKFLFSLITSYRELVWCTNHPNAHICTVCKRWSFIWWCLFPVSILKVKQPKRKEIVSISFSMFQMKFSRSPEYSKITWNSPEQPVELHSWYSYVVTFFVIILL